MASETWRPVGVPGSRTSETAPAGQSAARRGRVDYGPASGSVRLLVTPDGTTVMTLAGVVDSVLAGRLRARLVAVVLRSRPRRLVLDLREVVELDALIAGTIVAGCQVADDCDVEVVMALPADTIAGQLLRAGLPASVRTAA